jgi:hypothetical protein
MQLMQDFPDLEYQQIMEVLEAMNYNYNETVAILKSSNIFKIEIVSLDTFERSEISDSNFNADQEGM